MSSPEIITFGCRLNAFESEVMKGHAEKAGLKDTIIVNTCAVTNEAVRQARQAIRRAHRRKSSSPVAPPRSTRKNLRTSRGLPRSLATMKK